MRRTLSALAAALLLAGPAAAQLPRSPVKLRGPFGGVTTEQFYQSGIGLWAGQLAAEVGGLRAEIDRTRMVPATKLALTQLADQATRAAEAFRQVAVTTADRGRLYRAHEPVDQAINRLVAGVNQAGALTPGIAEAVARVQHADQQTHLAMTGGDTAEDVGRTRTARVAAALEVQTARLREVVRGVPALASDARLAQSLEAVATRAARLRQTLDAGGAAAQAAPEFRAAAAAWGQVADPLTRGFAAHPAVRLQAARVDGVVRSLAEAFPADPAVPPPPPLPRAGFVARGTLAVSAGETGGPRVRVFQSYKGGESVDFFAYDPNFRGGVRVAVADLNGDDVPDVVTAPGKGMAPLVRVFDGRTLGLMTEFMAYAPEWTGGVFVAAADLTPNGRALVVTGTSPGTGPHVKVFDLVAGKEIDSFYAYDESFTGGVRVALGDVDGDGMPDLVTGPGPGGGPVVKVYSGKDRSKLAEFLALDERDRGGVFVAAADVARGRRAEVIVGSANDAGPAVVRLFDALRGQHLADLVPYAENYRGGVRVAAHDYDGDGALDIICAPGPSPGLPVRVFSGKDRRPIADFVPFEATFGGGVFVGSR